MRKGLLCFYPFVILNDSEGASSIGGVVIHSEDDTLFLPMTQLKETVILRYEGSSSISMAAIQG